MDESFSCEFTRLNKLHVLTFLCQVTRSKGEGVNNSATPIPSKGSMNSVATHESLKCSSLNLQTAPHSITLKCRGLSTLLKRII
jgi:hypothetical protein